MISEAYKAYQISRTHSLGRAYTITRDKLWQRLRGPPNNTKQLYSQANLLDNLFNEGDVWLIWLDGGRFDYFEQLYPEYFEGRLHNVWNGGVGYTGDWSAMHLKRDLHDYALFSLADLQSFGHVDYDARDYFGFVPEIELERDVPMYERLAALGYRELESDSVPELEPERTNKAVREHMDRVNGGVVRYLKPHPPFEGLEEMTAGASKTRETRRALYTGALSERELCAAYERTYRTAFEHASELAKDLDGKIVITSDHGECLTCGQLFHGRHHVKHDHLCEVPWLEVHNVKA